MRRTKLTAILIAILGTTVLWSCSTTRRLPADEILYTGVKKINITTPEGTKEAPGLAGSVKNAVNVKPNNSLISPYLRYPFPLGLWVYNNWPNPPSGFRHWLYKKLVAEPVLISDVRPEVRTEMINQILDNNGYFRGNASYELVQGKNKKKADIRYNVATGPEYTLDSIIALPDTCRLFHLIDSVVARSPYMKRGMRYDTDSLSTLRLRIANAVRNKGYYFFKPEYIEYLADSTITPLKIAMKVTVAKNTPAPALMSWKTGKINTYIYHSTGEGTPDTMHTRKGDVIVMRPARLRPRLVPQCITFRPGSTFSVAEMNRTQTYLSRLGIFNGIDINVYPDTAAKEPTLDIGISCMFDSPIETSLEVNATSKSNSYLGPGLIFGVKNRNVFGGGEQLNVQLNASYEWQTGHDRRSIFNSYEFGLTATLAFPRLLAPRFIPRSRTDLNWTRLSLNGDLLNRPHYFRMGQFNGAISYDWRANRHVSNTLTAFKLTYTKLMRTTQEFDSIMDKNPAVAQSFMTQFIPQVAYTFTFDRAINDGHSLTWTFTVQEAGNGFWAVWSALGKRHGEKTLFGTPFSQFIKGSAQIVYGNRVKGNSWLFFRLASGAAHAYGNSSTVPYSEQFYVGGANSVRAFTVRSLGPGSYRPDASQVNGYFDQTGTFKFEGNIEYRFPIYSVLHGAVFFDAGNVWLLKKDPQRPGGELRGKSFLRDLATGTGFGLRVDIGMLIVRGDLGIGIHAPYNTGKRGYYNMTSFKNSLAFHLAIGYPF